jgi:hypothetical protein
MSKTFCAQAALFAGVAVGQKLIHQPLIPAPACVVVCDEQHICPRWNPPSCFARDTARSDSAATISFCWSEGFQNNVVVIGFWHGELQHIRRLNIRHLAEHHYEFRQV